MFQRSSGILLHITSLPSLGGIGDFGPAAYDFADFLHASGQKYWQILPLNPTDFVYGNCPYSSPSAFAMNMLFISPELLVNDGLLKKDELSTLPTPLVADKVDYNTVIDKKIKLLDQAFGRFKNSEQENNDFVTFCERNSFWLETYAAFVIFKKRFNGMIWSDWPDDIRAGREAILKEFRAKFVEDIKRVKFFQYIAFKQWALLREYCLQKGISFIGDIPIYVNEDSADVWGNPYFFKLSAAFKPVFVAGVPPDYFSKTGQRWGNPIYDWERIKASNYEWWMQRIRHNLNLFDVIRIDHFRGLMGYWEIPADEKTAVNGHWTKGPGENFLAHLRKEYPNLPIIAEDLGLITADVSEAMQKFNLPGMKVLHFAFGGDLKHPYLPENYPEQCIVYTGTHDNNTTRGWFNCDALPQEKEFLKTYLKKEVREETIATDLIDVALKSRAVLSIVPMQDVLNLNEKSRMNTPGTVLDNWEWRLVTGSLTKNLSQMLRQLIKKSNR